MFKLMCLAFIVAQVIDGFLTLWATNNGFIEANPLMAPIAHTWIGPSVKIIPTILVIWGISKLINKYPRIRKPATAGLTACIAFYAVIIYSNVSELI